MTERERLIEIIKQVPYGVSVGAKFTQQFSEKVADHLLANGVIAPTCKKDDVVYQLAHGYVEEERVRCVHVDYLTNAYGFSEKDIGTTVFVGEDAEENAKKALAEAYSNLHKAQAERSNHDR